MLGPRPHHRFPAIFVRRNLLAGVKVLQMGSKLVLNVPSKPLVKRKSFSAIVMVSILEQSSPQGRETAHQVIKA